MIDRERVTGVQTSAETSRRIVVDASGRGSQLPAWLEAHGHAPPEVSQLAIDLGYATRLYRMPPNGRDWQVMAVYPKPPDTKRRR